MWKEFKEFAVKGNAIDLAVGVIIGAAFGKIVTSMVDDLLMPVLGLALGKVDFSNLFVTLNGQHYDSMVAAKAAGAPTFNYGLFINNVINFLIIAFSIFVVVTAAESPQEGGRDRRRRRTARALGGGQAPHPDSRLAPTALRARSSSAGGQARDRIKPFDGSRRSSTLRAVSTVSGGIWGMK